MDYVSQRKNNLTMFPGIAVERIKDHKPAVILVLLDRSIVQ